LLATKFRIDDERLSDFGFWIADFGFKVFCQFLDFRFWNAARPGATCSELIAALVLFQKGSA
jgi:hypothetical protein